MKVTINLQISVDGVVQGNGGRHPVLDPGFDRGGWALPFVGASAMRYREQVYSEAEAFLFGRRTYELFAEYWGTRSDLDNPIVAALNSASERIERVTRDLNQSLGENVPMG